MAGSGAVVLTGPNGAGKTNLIEAISFLAPGRGLRRATLEDVAFSEGDGSWAVAAEIEGMLGLATLGTGIEPPTQRRCAGERGNAASTARACRSASAFADHLARRLARRRRWISCSTAPPPSAGAFFDRLVLAVDAQHSSRASNALERSLRSRNRLLEENINDPHWLDAVEHETAEVAVAVAAARAETVRRLRPTLDASRAGLAVPCCRDRARRLDRAHAGRAQRGARSRTATARC